MASSSIIPNILIKQKLSASDFRPFSLSSGSKPRKTVKPSTKKIRRGHVDRYSHDLNLFSLCTDNIIDSDDDSSSSVDESDGDDDDVTSSSKPSSSSGKASRTSSEQKRVRFRSPVSPESVGSETKKSVQSTTGSSRTGNSGPSSRGKGFGAGLVHAAREIETEVSVPVAKNPYADLTKAQILARMCQELFILPGDTATDDQMYIEGSSEDENIIEASCGHVPATVGDLSAQVFAEDAVTELNTNKERLKKAEDLPKMNGKIMESSPKKSENNTEDMSKKREINPEEIEQILEDLPKKSGKKLKDKCRKKEKEIVTGRRKDVKSLAKSPRKESSVSPVRANHQDGDYGKSKLLNCPVCGTVLIEKSMKLQDHYQDCHTPLRTDLNCLGHLPTHRHSDGSAFVRLGENERLTGNQCFICHRLCQDDRQLRLHWQLHKVYIPEEEANSAVDSETEDLSEEPKELEMNLGEDHLPSLYDPKLDISYSSDEEMLLADCTDDERESEIEMMKKEFESGRLAMVSKIECCSEVSPKGGSKKPRKRKVDAKTDTESVESCRRCPECDIAFKDAVTCSQHRLNDHGRKLMYRCVREECRKVFYHHRAYRDHHRSGHRQRAFICSLCNDHFSVYGLLISHQRKKHRFLAKFHPFQCDSCSISFPSEDLLSEHVIHRETLAKVSKADVTAASSLANSVASNGLGKCLICLSSFDDYVLFTKHIAEHFKKVYYCTGRDCTETKEDMHEMVKHLITHYEDKESLVCPRCGRVFQSAADNARHGRHCVHRCYLCSTSFLLEEELYVHFLKDHYCLKLICLFCNRVIPSLLEYVTHQKYLHLFYHNINRAWEPRIMVRHVTENILPSFPELVKKFPDIGNGLYVFATLGNDFQLPKWLFKTADERHDRAMKNMTKMTRVKGGQASILGRKRKLGSGSAEYHIKTRAEPETVIKEEPLSESEDVHQPLIVRLPSNRKRKTGVRKWKPVLRKDGTECDERV